jgi:hypothetical protein
MQAAFNKAMATRGAVYSILYQFPQDNTPRKKYCVLMEDYVNGKCDLAVIFTTSHLEYSYKDSCVLVEDGIIKGINGKTLIECDNWRLIQPKILFEDPKAQYLCLVPPEIMRLIENALADVRNIDEITLIRMLGDN